MFRGLQTNYAKNHPAHLVAGEEMTTGMLAQIDHSTDKVKKATDLKQLFLVSKGERVNATGSEVELSDYDPMFENIKAGELVRLTPLYLGEMYASDQTNDGNPIAKGSALTVADGKIVAATSGQDTFAVSDGEFTDNSHKLSAFTVQPIGKMA